MCNHRIKSARQTTRDLFSKLLLGGIAILSVGLLTAENSSAETTVQHANALYFEFLGNTSEMSAGSPKVKQNEQNDGGIFIEGAKLKGAELFEELNASADNGRITPESHMRDAYLVARLWNVSEEIFSHGIVAYCNELDFLSAQAAPLDQQVRCDDKIFSVDIDDKGIMLLENGKPRIRYELEAGVYALNDIPFLVE
ncbi:hypothetical protein [Pseudovibrio sp. Tun.PSC04-5.I4]|uniref:hypothetical protein n=1 Tax=Pseudovibrio sp. Tun.PSC04-5.I4 TaxID=1798213 RepID=UPI000883BF30|nr:hypothetical protein [Pseudovibrio sp. Tun.PSC04-5.I4]SDQ23935.1 hypothetical protein SAMN04515695_0620 [Pseudovibrio sp. Tun.PSC04-5.I4]